MQGKNCISPTLKCSKATKKVVFVYVFATPTTVLENHSFFKCITLGQFCSRHFKNCIGIVGQSLRWRFGERFFTLETKVGLALKTKANSVFEEVNAQL